MATIAAWLKVDEAHLVHDLQELGERLDAADGEVVLDWSSVQRIDPGAVKALQALADTAADKNINLSLRGVNVEIYKVLKLVKLAKRFSFVP